jgi:hypothetical protein
MKTITWNKFEVWRCFKSMPELDSLLSDKEYRDGVDIKVPRRGTYQIRPHPPLSGNCMRYGAYWITNSKFAEIQEDK